MSNQVFCPLKLQRRNFSNLFDQIFSSILLVNSHFQQQKCMNLPTNHKPNQFSIRVFFNCTKNSTFFNKDKESKKKCYATLYIRFNGDEHYYLKYWSSKFNRFLHGTNYGFRFELFFHQKNLSYSDTFRGYHFHLSKDDLFDLRKWY